MGAPMAPAPMTTTLTNRYLHDNVSEEDAS